MADDERWRRGEGRRGCRAERREMGADRQMRRRGATVNSERRTKTEQIKDGARTQRALCAAELSAAVAVTVAVEIAEEIAEEIDQSGREAEGEAEGKAEVEGRGRGRDTARHGPPQGRPQWRQFR